MAQDQVADLERALEQARTATWVVEPYAGPIEVNGTLTQLLEQARAEGLVAAVRDEERGF